MKSYFTDIPVYRLSSDEYYEAQEAEIRKEMGKYWNSELMDDEFLRVKFSQRTDDYYRRFGPWKFNEIVGYIRLYFLGTQIRGEYFSSEKKRTFRTRTKIFTWKAFKLAAEVQSWHPYSSAGILEGIYEYLSRCKSELNKSRFIDTEEFDKLAPYIDWLKLFEEIRK